MCGIAGELRLTPGERPSPERVRAMCDVMVHRGPDSFGEFTHGEVAFGMRRLAIVDVAGRQAPLGPPVGDVRVHRGPASSGESTHGEVAFGMRRLAIVDVAGGQQPLGNEDGSVQVVCNGEIYNAPGLMRDLEARGHRLRTRS